MRIGAANENRNSYSADELLGGREGSGGTEGRELAVVTKKYRVKGRIREIMGSTPVRLFVA